MKDSDLGIPPRPPAYTDPVPKPKTPERPREPERPKSASVSPPPPPSRDSVEPGTERFETTCYGNDGKPTIVSLTVQGDIDFGLRQIRLFVDEKLGAGGQVAQSKPVRGRPVGTTNAELERRRNEIRSDAPPYPARDDDKVVTDVSFGGQRKA